MRRSLTVVLALALSPVNPAFAAKGGSGGGSTGGGSRPSSGGGFGGGSRPSGGGFGGGSKPSTAPRPSYTPPKPSYTPPKPSYTPPKPSYTPPKPSYTPPKPAPVQPKPQPVQPKPQPKPVQPTQPKPQPVQPKPVQPTQPHTGVTPPGPRPTQPQGGYKRTPTKDGGVIEDRGNHVVKYRPDGSKEYMQSGARTVQYRKDGTKAQESRGGVVTDFHKDGSHTVTKYGVQQYTQHQVVRDNKTYITRTYTHDHVTVVKNYNVYHYGGYSYHSYVPVIAYDPWFYGYVYRPWTSPYAYHWGWASDPWYGHYGYYYRPYATYYSPCYWLTDYLISDLLAVEYANSLARAKADAAYATRQAADAQYAAEQARLAAAPVITEDIKSLIKDQVEQAIKAHEAKQPLTLQAVTRDTRHIFAVTDELDATVEGTQNTCSLSTGDLIRLAEVPAEGSPAASIVVVTSKRGNCPAGSRLAVAMSDLQEYLNDFSERMEKGMEKMKKEVADKAR